MHSSNLTFFTLSHLLDKSDVSDMKNCVSQVCSKIPPSNKIENNNIFSEIKHKMNNINYWHYMKLKYIDTCCWLVEELDKKIEFMVNDGEYEKDIIYYCDSHNTSIEGLAFATDPDIDDHYGGILQAWIKMGLGLPFFDVKQNLELKGYELTIDDYQTTTITDNKHIFYPSVDLKNKSIETYKLTIKIIKNFIDKKRSRDSQQKKDETKKHRSEI